MTFKTKAQIFGDNGVNGLQVPISVSNPPGTAAANRGVGFGEGVTAAIANRTTAALAENDEDVNARLAVLETTGLDGAYRGGAAAVPGIGRVVTVDGGAVEVEGDAANTDAVGALLRSTMRAAGGDVGFDVVGPGVGLLRRAPRAFIGNTILPASSVAAVLNPAGAGTDIVEIAGPNQFATAGDTELAIGQDLLIVSGAGAYDGVYWVTAVLTDFRLQVAGFMGPVSFPATTAAQVRVERVSLLEDDGSLSLRPAAAGVGLEVLSPVDGTGSFFEAQRLDATGSPVTLLRIDPLAAIRQTWDNAGLSALESRTPERAAQHVDARTTAIDGRPALIRTVEHPTVDISTFIPSGSPGLSAEYSEITLNLVSGPFTYLLPAPVTLIAATNDIEFAASNPAHGLFRVFDFIELSGTAGGTFDGTYVVTELDPTAGTGRIRVVRLDGVTPSFAAGAGTLRYLQVTQISGGALGTAGTDLSVVPTAERGKHIGAVSGGAPTIKAAAISHVLRGQGILLEANAVFFGSRQLHSPEDTSNLHGFEPGCIIESGGDVYVGNLIAHDEANPGAVDKGSIKASGRIEGAHVMLFGDGVSPGYIEFGGPTNRGVERLVRVVIPTDRVGWDINPGGSPGMFVATALNSTLYLDLVFEQAVEITGIYARVTPAVARATTTDRVRIDASLHTTDGTTGALVSNVAAGASVYDDGTTGAQVIGWSSLSLLPGWSGNAAALRIKIRSGLTSTVTDQVDAVWVTVKSLSIR